MYVYVCPQENLLDRHEFLKWLVEEEFIKVTDNKVLQLYLPLVLTVSHDSYSTRLFSTLICALNLCLMW